MQAVSKVEILDVQPNILTQPIKATDVNSTVGNINGGSQKATFRKFAAEQALQPQVQFEQSLTDRFNSGLLQNDILVKKINPHTMIHKAILENSPVVIRNLSSNSSRSLYGTLLGAFRASALVKITVPIFTSGGRRRKIASKSTINESLRIGG